MRKAKASTGDEAFVDMLCFLVESFGVSHTEVMDMPYLRSVEMLEYSERKAKEQKRTMDSQNSKQKTFR